MTELSNPAASPESPRSSGTRVRVLILGGLGAAAIVAGFFVILISTREGGGAALVAVGGVLLLFAAFGDRLESLKYGDLELVLRRKAEAAADAGDVAAAADLARAADRIGARMQGTAESYRFARRDLPSGPARTAALEQLIDRARADGRDRAVDLDEVRRQFWTGDEGLRIWALGVLQERLDLVTPRMVINAVERPDHLFDQFHGLVLADKYVSMSTTKQLARTRVVRSVRGRVDSGDFDHDVDCLSLARAILGKDHGMDLPHRATAE